MLSIGNRQQRISNARLSDYELQFYIFRTTSTSIYFILFYAKKPDCSVDN